MGLKYIGRKNLGRIILGQDGGGGLLWTARTAGNFLAS